MQQTGTSAETVSQLQLSLTYRALMENGGPLPSFRDVGFSAFSQTDEDGILLYIFSLIGTGNKRSVEICAGDGIECNTANLLIHHGWTGLLVDGDAAKVRRGIRFYRRNRATRIHPPVFAHAWLTRDNINTVIRESGFEGEIDLLSLDVDGMDYWLLDAIDVIDPRVVVVEYQDILGPDRALTVPYSADFDASKYPTTLGTPNYCGASLAAFVKLAGRRGYRLVGCNTYGFNAFFVKESAAVSELATVAVADCFRHPKVLWGMKERFPTVQHLPWVEV